MLVVGLTGGIASGKTTVSSLLEEEGAYLIDVDRIAKDLVRPHTAVWHALVKAFGEGILEGDGSIGRKKLAAMVFSNPDRRKTLEDIVHPEIDHEIRRRLKGIREKDPDAIVIVDAALLVETAAYRRMDRLIVVTATKTQQIERLKQRTGAPEEEAMGIISSQMALEEKLKVADFVLPNEGSLEETRRRAKEIFRELGKLAREKRKDSVF